MPAVHAFTTRGEFVYRRFMRASVTLLTAFALALGIHSSATAELQASKTFTRFDSSYTKTDRNGHFTGQVTWGAPKLPMAWSFKLAPQLRAIATSPMTCKAGHMQLPYSDTHRDVGVDYTWHSTVSGNLYNARYTLWGYCTFRVNVGGQTGTAKVSFRFNYSIARTASDPLSAGTADLRPHTTDRSITWDKSARAQ